MFEPLPDDLAAACAADVARLGPYGMTRFCGEVASTNDLALALAANGAPEGVSVLADTQHRGRGRRGHDWHSPAGAGIYLSVVVRPDMSQGQLPMVTIAAGVAVADAVVLVSGLPVELKWPNDLVIGRPWRKLGGVLAETVTTGARIDAVVVGIGINVLPAAFPPALASTATAIESELGRPIERARLVVELLVAMRTMMAMVHRGDRPGIAARWRAHAAPGLRRRVSWQESGRTRHGVAQGIDDEGALLVSGDGAVQRIVAGDVTWEPTGE